MRVRRRADHGAQGDWDSTPIGAAPPNVTRAVFLGAVVQYRQPPVPDGHLRPIPRTPAWHSMQTRARTTALVGAAAVLAAAILFFTLGDDHAPPPSGAAGDHTAGAGAAPVTEEFAAQPAAVAPATAEGIREQVKGGTVETGVRGIVLSAENGLPLGGIEVIAVVDEPSIEPLVARFR